MAAKRDTVIRNGNRGIALAVCWRSIGIAFVTSAPSEPQLNCAIGHESIRNIAPFLAFSQFDKVGISHDLQGHLIILHLTRSLRHKGALARFPARNQLKRFVGLLQAKTMGHG